MMGGRELRILGLLTAVVLALSACGSTVPHDRIVAAASATKSPVASSAGEPVAGPVSPGGDAGQRPGPVWAASVNDRGGLNGHPVAMVVADDGADPSRAASIARDMVETRGVIAFVGNIEPLSVSGIKGYLEAKKVPVVGVDGAIETWWQSPVFFPAFGYIETGIIGGADV